MLTTVSVCNESVCWHVISGCLNNQLSAYHPPDQLLTFLALLSAGRQCAAADCCGWPLPALSVRVLCSCFSRGFWLPHWAPCLLEGPCPSGRCFFLPSGLTTSATCGPWLLSSTRLFSLFGVSQECLPTAHCPSTQNFYCYLMDSVLLLETWPPYKWRVPRMYFVLCN